MADTHDSPIKTPRHLINAVVLAFIVPIFAIVMLVKYVSNRHAAAAGSQALSVEAVGARIAPVARVNFVAAGEAHALQTGEAVFKGACNACHGAGIAGAPKFGDAAAWGPRIKQGYDTLVQHAVNGFKTMPPRGGNAALDPVEVARAVAYMANAGGASFKEP